MALIEISMNKLFTTPNHYFQWKNPSIAWSFLSMLIFFFDFNIFRFGFNCMEPKLNILYSQRPFEMSNIHEVAALLAVGSLIFNFSFSIINIWLGKEIFLLWFFSDWYIWKYVFKVKINNWNSWIDHSVNLKWWNSSGMVRKSIRKQCQSITHFKWLSKKRNQCEIIIAFQILDYAELWLRI